jgi:hypothetical protein
MRSHIFSARYPIESTIHGGCAVSTSFTAAPSGHWTAAEAVGRYPSGGAVVVFGAGFALVQKRWSRKCGIQKMLVKCWLNMLKFG